MKKLKCKYCKKCFVDGKNKTKKNSKLCFLSRKLTSE